MNTAERAWFSGDGGRIIGGGGGFVWCFGFEGTGLDGAWRMVGDRLVGVYMRIVGSGDGRRDGRLLRKMKGERIRQQIYEGCV
ncbi:hypothetical protein Tco_1227436 [Tanacetum coccineum]